MICSWKMILIKVTFFVGQWFGRWSEFSHRRVQGLHWGLWHEPQPVWILQRGLQDVPDQPPGQKICLWLHEGSDHGQPLHDPSQQADTHHWYAAGGKNMNPHSRCMDRKHSNMAVAYFSLLCWFFQASPERSTRTQQKEFQSNILDSVMEHLLAADVLLGQQTKVLVPSLTSKLEAGV